jgi:hypothetical protein
MGYEPYWYLRFLFDGLVRAQTEAELSVLLPQNVDPKALITAGRYPLCQGSCRVWVVGETPQGGTPLGPKTRAESVGGHAVLL